MYIVDVRPPVGSNDNNTSYRHTQKGVSIGKIPVFVWRGVHIVKAAAVVEALGLIREHNEIAALVEG